jgi:hypothetical protein
MEDAWFSKKWGTDTDGANALGMNFDECSGFQTISRELRPREIVQLRQS